MGNKLYIISDAHLGTGSDSLGRERQLCQLLDQIKADAKMVVMLGDMFDFWFSYKHLVPRGHVRLLGKMAELHDAGIPLHYWIGNHDMWLFDYLNNETGATMHSEPEVLEFDGHRFLLGHGDGLNKADKQYLRLKRIFRNRLCQKAFTCLPSSLTFAIAHKWSNSSRASHSANPSDTAVHENSGITAYCTERLNAEHIDFCAFGHTHTPLTQQLASDSGHPTTLVNVGDWLDHRTYAVYSNGTLQLTSLD